VKAQEVKWKELWDNMEEVVGAFQRQAFQADDEVTTI